MKNEKIGIGLTEEVRDLLELLVLFADLHTKLSGQADLMMRVEPTVHLRV